ncbi:MAG: hypothetical protein AB7O98_06805 [Hyphomonadaceae bacterium]
MIGLVSSELILFAVAVVLGFAIGWRLYVMVSAGRRRVEQREVEDLRHGLSETQVRRAR